MIRRILIFIAAVLATLCAASLTHTQIILSGLSDLGAEIPFGVRLSTSLTDLIGLAPAFGSVIAIALLLRPAAFGIAGGAAMATTLWLMQLSYDITPIASTRTPVGLLLICMAGVFGGVIFARGTKPATGH
jgi:hypothetical protein